MAVSLGMIPRNKVQISCVISQDIVVILRISVFSELDNFAIRNGIKCNFAKWSFITEQAKK